MAGRQCLRRPVSNPRSLVGLSRDLRFAIWRRTESQCQDHLPGGICWKKAAMFAVADATSLQVPAIKLQLSRIEALPEARCFLLRGGRRLRVLG